MSDTPDARYLSKLAKDYEAEGLGRDEAIARAVAERISGSRLEQKSILEQVQKQAGKNPALLKRIFPQGLDLPANLDEIDEQITSASSPKPTETAADLPTPTSAAVPPVNDIPPAKPPDAPAVKVEDAPDGKLKGLSNRETQAIDEAFGFKDKAPVQREADLKIAAEAKIEGYHTRADEIAESVLADKRGMTRHEFAGLVFRRVEYEDQLSSIADEIEAAVKSGDESGASALREREADIRYHYERIVDAAEVAGTEQSRDFRFRQTGANNEDSYGTLTYEAKKVKGAPLTDKEIAYYREESKQIATLKKVVKELQAKYDTQLAKREKIVAEEVLKRESAVGVARRRSAGAKEKILAERADIEAKLRARGVRVNVGFDPEESYLMGRLAISYIHEGVTSLDELVTKMREKVPDATERDIRAALNARSPQAMQRVRSESVKQVSELKRQARLMNQIEDAEKGIFDKPSANRQVESETVKGLRKQLSQLRNSAWDQANKGVDPRKLEKVIEKIDQARDQLMNHYRLVRKGQKLPPPEIVALKKELGEIRKLMAVEDRIADIDNQIRTGKFTINAPKIDMPIPKDLEDAQIRLAVKKRQVRHAIREAAPKTFGTRAEKAFNTTRSLLATADMSGWFRQNIVPVLSHPIKAAKIAPQATRAFFSERAAEVSLNNIRNSKNYLRYEKSKLVINELDGTLSRRQEQFGNSFIERFPLVRASNRNMTTIGNMMRTTLFDDFIEKVPNATDAELAAYADFLNKATGIGDISMLGKSAEKAGMLFFAPKLAVSRFQTPLALIKARGNPRVQKAIARDIGGFVASGMSFLGVLYAAGQANPDLKIEVGLNPDSADFGKVRIGDTRFDIWGGFQQPTRLITRMIGIGFDRAGITGKNLVESELRDDDPLGLSWQFFRYKFHPTINMLAHLGSGEDAVGNKTTIPEALIKSFTPLLLQDIYEAYKNDGIGMAVGAGAASFVGVGASTYKDGENATKQKILNLQRAGETAKAKQLADEWNAANPQDKIQTILSSPLYPKKGGDSFFDRDSKGIKRHYDSTKAEKERKELEKATGATR